MNLGQYLLGYLQENGTVELPGFGVFFVQKKSAILDETESKLLPPTFEIFFERKPEVFNSDLSKYISDNSDENLFIVQSKIKEQVLLWNQELLEKKLLSVDEIGEFSLENGQIVLNSKTSLSKNPSFFGLEEINLKDIKEKKETAEKKDSDNDYVFNKSILWIFLFILPVGGILYLAIGYQEKIFGKKSFDMSVKNSTHRIEKKFVIKKDSTKKDSIKNTVKDSLKISK